MSECSGFVGAMFLEHLKLEQCEIGEFPLSYYSIGSLQSQVRKQSARCCVGCKSLIVRGVLWVMYEWGLQCSWKGREIRTKEWLVDAIVPKLL